MSMTKRVLGPVCIIGTGTGANAKYGSSGVSGDMSAASITSKVQDVKFIDNVSIELAWTGAPVGTLAIYESLTGVNFGDPLQIPINNPNGSAKSVVLDLNQLSGFWVKIVYTKTSGTGTLQGFIGGKEV